MNNGIKALCASALAAIAMGGAWRMCAAETCVTQSQMQPPDREALAAAASALATKIQANDQAGLRGATIAEFQNDFAGIAQTISATAPKVKGLQTDVDELYLLDASTLKPGNGVNPDAQFFCTLNNSANEAEFSIPQLPPGKYAFAMVRMEGDNPWLLSFLLRQDGGKWLLAGLYPRPTSAGGHDGLWYWEQARTLKSQMHPWDAWLYLQESQSLLLPANFVTSTHLEKLQAEISATVPPALANGIGSDTPLVIKGADGVEYRFTGLGVDDSVGLDVAAHLKVDALADAALARKRNIDAMTALLAAHPELRTAFHGVWVFAEAPGRSPYATEEAMQDIH